MPLITSRSIEFATPWFDLVAKKMHVADSPYYSLRMPDYVSVIAFTCEQEVVLVRQYRPAVERYTIELPGGNLEAGESPDRCACRELEEETGYHADKMELLGTLLSDTGRHENGLWCYFADNVTPLDDKYDPEPGIEVVLVHWSTLIDMICKGDYNHALHLAVIMLALAKHGQLSPSDFRAHRRG